MNILVTIPYAEEEKERLAKICPDAVFTFSTPDDADASIVSEADIILGNVKPTTINMSPRLKWLHLSFAGADTHTAEGVLSPDTILTNSSGAYGIAISEHMLGMLLMMFKKLGPYYDGQKNKSWDDRGIVRPINGSKTLILGLGDIGRQFAIRMHALGSTVTGIKKHLDDKPDYVEKLVGMDSLDEELSTADIVACCLPNSKETVHLFDAERFKLMKPDSFIINVGRGSLIDGFALANALNSGTIGGACLDVTEPEPLPKDHPLWTAKNTFITPHVSGRYFLPETLRRIKVITEENLKAYMAGKTLKNLVDRKTGYRDNTPSNILM